MSVETITDALKVLAAFVKRYDEQGLTLCSA
jgi:hypothetical protein